MSADRDPERAGRDPIDGSGLRMGVRLVEEEDFPILKGKLKHQPLNLTIF